MLLYASQDADETEIFHQSVGEKTSSSIFSAPDWGGG